MQIPKEEVEKLAKLVRLKFSDAEKDKVAQEMSGILDYVDQLKGIQEKSQSTGFVDPDAINLMRDDFAENSVPPKDLLSQAPDREGDFVKVKSVLE